MKGASCESGAPLFFVEGPWDCLRVDENANQFDAGKNRIYT